MALLVADVLRHAARYTPNRLAATLGEYEITFGALDEQANRIYYEPRCHEGNYGLPTMFVGARAEDRARILAAGFQAHLPKPVEPVELTATIAAVTQDLRRRGSRPRNAR